MILFHGRNVVVTNPKVLINGFYKDFGYGFYCTNLEKQARRWALTKRKNHIVNKYSYQPDDSMNICQFPEMTEEWLDFVVDCRRGIEHNYDIVEGSMADDTIWDYIDGLIRVYDGEICENIDNYNASAYYEPSYVITRAYNEGGF